MTTPQFEDRCSKCNKPVTRVIRLEQVDAITMGDMAVMMEQRDGARGSRFGTSCCGASTKACPIEPLAVPVVKE